MSQIESEEGIQKNSDVKISIRPAKIEDTKSLVILSDQLGYIAGEEDIRRRLAVLLNHPDNCVYVAETGSEILGWVHGFYTMRLESDFFVEIGGLVINERYRNLGIGRALEDEVLSWAEHRQTSKVRVRCNLIREQSHQFYEKIGFRVNKSQKVFDREI